MFRPTSATHRIPCGRVVGLSATRGLQRAPRGFRLRPAKGCYRTPRPLELSRKKYLGPGTLRKKLGMIRCELVQCSQIHVRRKTRERTHAYVDRGRDATCD